VAEAVSEDVAAAHDVVAAPPHHLPSASAEKQLGGVIPEDDVAGGVGGERRRVALREHIEHVALLLVAPLAAFDQLAVHAASVHPLAEQRPCRSSFGRAPSGASSRKALRHRTNGLLPPFGTKLEPLRRLEAARKSRPGPAARET
jgi:hypothetical protein